MNSYKYKNNTAIFTPEKKEYTLTGLNTGHTLLCYFTNNKIYLSEELMGLYLYRVIKEEVLLFLRDNKVIITNRRVK